MKYEYLSDGRLSRVGVRKWKGDRWVPYLRTEVGYYLPSDLEDLPTHLR